MMSLFTLPLHFYLQYKFVTPLTSMVVTKPDEKDVGSFEENEDAQRKILLFMIA